MNANIFFESEQSFQCLLQLAKAIGLHEAMVLRRLHELLNEPGTTVEREGHTWVRSTYEQWHKYFSFWCTRTIREILHRLEKAGLIITAQFDKSHWDQTKYYRIDYPALGDLSNFLFYDEGGKG